MSDSQRASMCRPAREVGPARRERVATLACGEGERARGEGERARAARARAYRLGVQKTRGGSGSGETSGAGRQCSGESGYMRTASPIVSHAAFSWCAIVDVNGCPSTRSRTPQ